MIPVIDLETCGQSPDKLAEAVRESASTIGFLAFLNHGLEREVAEMFAISKELFLNESKEEKERCRYQDNKGYTVVRQEVLDPVLNPEGDMKEGFNLMTIPRRTLAAQQPLPPTLESRKAKLADFQYKCHELCQRLLAAFALVLGVPTDHFTSQHSPDEDSTSILRFLRYPHTPAGTAASSNRAGAHSDYGSVTLLWQLSQGGEGLQILPPWESISSGKWVDAGIIEGAVLVNIGDALEYWSGGRLKSTLHRVVVPDSKGKALPDRYSLAYFCQPVGPAVLESVVPQAEITQNDLERMRRKGVEPGKVVTSAEHLAMRLDATYTHKSGLAIS